MIQQEEEALVPLVRKRKKNPVVAESDAGPSGSAKKLLSQTINISKVGSSGNSTTNKLSNRIKQKFNLKSKEDRKLYYIICVEVKKLYI